MADEQPSAIDPVSEHLREATVEAERHLRHAQGHSDGEALGHHTRLALALWRFSFILDAWAQVDPVAARQAAEAMQFLAETDSPGDWVMYKLLKQGISPDTVAPLTCCQAVPAAG